MSHIQQSALLVVGGLAYLALLFLIAELTERSWIPRKVSQHPLVFSLSLGVYATSWTFFGSVGLAGREGYGFLTIYLGVTLSCLAIPVLWLPLARVVQTQQLSNLADLMAYRYQSSLAGALVALLMLVASLPYIALQLRSVGEVAHILVPELGAPWVSLFFGAVIAVFALLFGARHVSPQDAQFGLTVSMAFESVVKLVALSAVGALAWFHHLGGINGIQTWLNQHPEALETLIKPTHSDTWITLTFLSFCAAFLLPRQFHMAFARRPSESAFLGAIWALPLYLLCLSLPIPLLLWSAQILAHTNNPDFFVVELVANTPALATLVFLGGISASSGMVIVCSVALANMTMNHLILPIWRPIHDFYRSVIWLRRTLIAIVVLAGYTTYIHLNEGVLAEWGLLTFVAVAQFVPGIIGVLFWSRANRWGFILGLLAGSMVWMALLVCPSLDINIFSDTLLPIIESIFPSFESRWTKTTWVSLLVNTICFLLGSLGTSYREEEYEAAQICAVRGFPAARTLTQRTAEQLIEDLELTLGPEVAEREVERARHHLGLLANERRPLQLGQLEKEVTNNLSGIVGPTVARKALGGKQPIPLPLADQILLLQEHLSNKAPPPSAAQMIDLVRRYFGDVLESLPIGVCAVGATQEILIWNQTMVQLSELQRRDCVGHSSTELPMPWSRLLTLEETSASEIHVDLPSGSRLLRIGYTGLGNGGRVFIVEDLTEQRLLETKMAHEDRLRSIGRLAAGVAHDIGNPLAGILLIARNLLEESNPEDAEERLNLVISEGSRIKEIVESLSTFSRRGRDAVYSPTHTRKEVDLNQTLEDALRLVRLTHRETPCIAHHEVHNHRLKVMGDAQQLTQVWVNLLTNACDASQGGTKVTLSVHQASEQVKVCVIDSGEGIDPETQKHIFEPFFTTKDLGRGTGLGLSIVHHIVDHHEGSIEVESTKGQGSCFTVILKAVEDLPS